jgi:hypothetical protein
MLILIKLNIVLYYIILYYTILGPLGLQAVRAGFRKRISRSHGEKNTSIIYMCAHYFIAFFIFFLSPPAPLILFF